MSFNVRHHNRLYFPPKHIIICEDDLDNQRRFASFMCGIFEPQGTVRFSFVADAISAALITDTMRPVLIVLDYDMPFGNGHDLIMYFKNKGYNVPILTATGWEPNNASFAEVLNDYQGEYVISLKEKILNGENNEFILKCVK